MRELKEKEVTAVIIADDDSVMKLQKTISSVEACSTPGCALTKIFVIDATSKGITSA